MHNYKLYICFLALSNIKTFLFYWWIPDMSGAEPYSKEINYLRLGGIRIRLSTLCFIRSFFSLLTWRIIRQWIMNRFWNVPLFFNRNLSEKWSKKLSIHQNIMKIWRKHFKMGEIKRNLNINIVKGRPSYFSQSSKWLIPIWYLSLSFLQK